MTTSRSFRHIHQALYALKPAMLDKIRGQTVMKLMRRNAQEHAHDPALYSSPTHQYKVLNSMTWQEVHQSAAQIAAFLLKRKITKQTVLVMSRNRPEHFISDLAALYAQNTPASIYTTLTSEQIADIVKVTHASCIIIDDLEMYRRVEQALQSISHRPLLILMAPHPKKYLDTIGWSAAIREGRSCLTDHQETIDKIISDSSAQDVACIIFTSGTTGKPKGAMLTHENVLFAAATIQVVGTEHIPRAKLVSYLPLAHVFERVVGYYGWIYSRHVVYCVWSVNELKEAIVAVQPTIFVGVPRVYEKIEQGIRSKLASSVLSGLFQCALANATYCQHLKQAQKTIPRWRKWLHGFFSHLLFRRIRRSIGLDDCKLCLSGSAPLDSEVIGFFAAMDLSIVEGYGLTENSAPATVSWNEDLFRNMRRFFKSQNIELPSSFVCMPGRVGLPMPGTKVRTDAQGAISVYGPHVFKGYLHDQRQTDAALDRKWLRTGDLGTIHSSGELEIVGRKKDLIILSNGKNIAPRHIESAIARHPLVAHVCLYGDGMAYLAAVICLRYDGGEKRYAKSHHIRFHTRRQLTSNPTIQRLIRDHVADVNRHFSRPEQVKYFHLTSDVWSSDTGELTPTLKLKRRIIIDQYSQQIQTIYKKHDPNQHQNGEG
jgi:long-chain acyl-CoA synthetase